MNSGFNTDLTMKELWSNLARDFRAWTYPELGQRHEAILRSGSVTQFRDEPWADKLNAPVHICKAQYQLEALFKRYRFADDKFSDEDLHNLTVQKFLDTQERISSPIVMSPVLNRVIPIAARIIADILGDFDQDELMESCRFGKKATQGNPLHRSYLDVKLQDKITGSTEQIRWFREEYLPFDPTVEGAILDCQKTKAIQYEICDTLGVALVEKSYKSLRVIMPNTLIGSFRSKGLGVMIEKRLKANVGLDIRKLQMIHQSLVRKASLDRRLVTADLTSASDSITERLLEMLLPPAWFSELCAGRLTRCCIGTRIIELNTFMTMGIGFTFPLQTLIFYALLKAIGSAAGIRGRISVYGDDLIYPRELHKYVVPIFLGIHLQINKEKTYVNSYFRESCGADCFHGSDVRPFNPEGQHQMLRRKHYVLFLYKTLNGLLRRWDPLEIPGTVKFLLAEILLVDGIILQVPPSFPDESGFKVRTPTNEAWYAKVQRDHKIFGFSFKYLRTTNSNRVVLCQTPYLWEKLQVATVSCKDEENPYDIQLRNTRAGHMAYLQKLTICIDTFIWERIKNRPYPLRFSVNRKRLYRTNACVKHKTHQTIERLRTSTSVWA